MRYVLLLPITLLLLALASLSVASADPADAPTLVSPANGSTLSLMEATLAWDLPPGASLLHLQVTPANGDGPGVDLVLGAVRSFRLPPPPAWYGLLPDMTYSWRLRSSPE